MNRRNVLIGLLAAAPGSLAAQAAREPIDIVRALYAPERANTPPAYPFSHRLQGLYDAASARSRELNEPVSGLDFAFEFPLAFVAVALAGTVGLALAVMLAPLRRAVRLKPGEALRHV